jgi:hypothetical protein
MMDLAKVAARLRPRTSWEAADLGLLLAQRFFKPIAIGWLICVLPIVAIAAAVSATTSYFWLPLLLIWWLKPLYDRVPLLILSRAFFGEVPGAQDTAGHVFRAWRSGPALADITWRRFSPYRGVTMPVRELEKLRGSASSERLGILLRRHVKSPALWLLVVGLATELLFVGASVLLLTMVVPEAVGLDVGDAISQLFDTETNTPLAEVLAFVFYFLAMSAVEICYAAASFGLYINRRVRLEGWDIEIVFKKLAVRLRQRARSVIETAAMVLLVVFSCVSFGAQPAAAQEQAPQEVSGHAATSAPDQTDTRDTTQEFSFEKPQQAIEEILDDQEFGATSTEERWEMRDDLFDRDSDQDEESADPSGPSELLRALATTLQIVMWILAGLAVLAAVFYFFKKVGRPESGQAPEEPLDGPQTEFVEQQEKRQMTLPVDIVDAAVALWKEAKHAESLSVLYRGTISGLADGYAIEIDPSMTARECAKKVREAGGPADYVAEMARAWNTTVYADRRVSDEEARELFAAWRHHFRRATR